MCYIVTDGAFSIGFSFNYWNEFKWGSWESRTEYIDEDGIHHLNNWYYNEKIADGYHIKPKYSNFKQEIANYEYIDFRQHYKLEISVKAKTYMETFTVKSIPSAMHNKTVYKYGISHGTPIAIQHLSSIILYTDYTKLSANFTSTFRKHGAFETLSMTKARNKKYGWWSKILHEAVQIYGDSRAAWCRESAKRSHGGDEAASCTKPGHGMMDRGTLKGLFFCGMSSVMNLPQFHISLLSPTSTSMHLQVALKFSGESGKITEFNNASDAAERTRAFDVSFLSRYREEDERYCYLFISIGRILHCFCLCYLLQIALWRRESIGDFVCKNH